MFATYQQLIGKQILQINETIVTTQKKILHAENNINKQNVSARANVSAKDNVSARDNVSIRANVSARAATLTASTKHFPLTKLATKKTTDQRLELMEQHLHRQDERIFNYVSTIEDLKQEVSYYHDLGKLKFFDLEITLSELFLMNKNFKLSKFSAKTL